jgi:hypothetical protein
VNIKQRRERVLRILDLRNRFQFGQPKKTTSKTGYGKFACTDTCIQLIVKIVRNKNVSLNEVRRRSKAPSTRGMKGSEARRALRRFGMDYDVMYGKDADDVIRMVKNRGPVILAEMYWAHPEWKGYRYFGRTMDGRATDLKNKLRWVGFAKNKRGKFRAGKTQWNFKNGHAVLVATVLDDGGIAVRDPNHNSRIRPERPAYDVINKTQLTRMLKSWPYGYTYILAPKSKVVN